RVPGWRRQTGQHRVNFREPMSREIAFIPFRLDPVQNGERTLVSFMFLEHGRHQNAGVQKDLHKWRFRPRSPASTRARARPRSSSMIFSTVSWPNEGPPPVEKTSARPFRTKPPFALLGVNVTVRPEIETANTSPGLMASSRLTPFGSTSRPARSMGTNNFFMPFIYTITTYLWQYNYFCHCQPVSAKNAVRSILFFTSVKPDIPCSQ